MTDPSSLNQVPAGNMDERTNHNAVKIDGRTGKSTITKHAVVATPHIVQLRAVKPKTAESTIPNDVKDNDTKTEIDPNLPNPYPNGLSRQVCNVHETVADSRYITEVDLNIRKVGGVGDQRKRNEFTHVK